MHPRARAGPAPPRGPARFPLLPCTSRRLALIEHYKNVSAFTINLNFLFDDQKKDRILDKISSFTIPK